MKYTTHFPDGTSKTRTSKKDMKFSVVALGSDGKWKDLSSHTTYQLAEKNVQKFSKWGCYTNLCIVPVV